MGTLSQQRVLMPSWRQDLLPKQVREIVLENCDGVIHARLCAGVPAFDFAVLFKMYTMVLFFWQINDI